MPGRPGLCRDVGVHGRCRSLRDSLAPALVAATGLECVPGEVEVILEALGREVRGRWADLHEIRAPGATQRNRRLVEEHVQVDGLVRLPVAALLRLSDEPYDRRVALGQRRLVGEVGGRRRSQQQRGRGRGEEDPRAHCSTFDANTSNPRRLNRSIGAAQSWTGAPGPRGCRTRTRGRRTASRAPSRMKMYGIISGDDGADAGAFL